MLSKQWMQFGIISAFFGVVFGAFGAHFLKDKLTERYFTVFQTGVHYQMFHALALIALGIWATQNPSADTRTAGWAFTAGIMIFSGSLYALALTQIKILGAITPIGGVSFLAGWIAFAFLNWKA
jgi:uncharacterized membrane protein YgdD (TMEM256/DUF423 family)